MLSEGKILKYLLYAVGEIVLVIIGILIALQINNANIKSKKTQDTELYVDRLQIELENNLKRIESNLLPQYSRYLSDLNESIEIIRFPNCNSEQDSLEVFDAWVTLEYTRSRIGTETSVYEEGINNGLLYNLDPLKLRTGIINHYEFYRKSRNPWAIRVTSVFDKNLHDSQEYFKGLVLSLIHI